MGLKEIRDQKFCQHLLTKEKKRLEMRYHHSHYSKQDERKQKHPISAHFTEKRMYIPDSGRNPGPKSDCTEKIHIVGFTRI